MPYALFVEIAGLAGIRDSFPVGDLGRRRRLCSGCDLGKVTLLGRAPIATIVFIALPAAQGSRGPIGRRANGLPHQVSATVCVQAFSELIARCSASLRATGLRQGARR